jgi:translocation and assembly module TamB
MTRRRRLVLIAAGGAAALALTLTAVGVLVLQSTWFYEQVRTRLVATVEKATGGRVEIQSFRFYWWELRAEVKGFVLHGTEPAGKPPLLRADSVNVGLKIVSLSRRDVDLQSLEVAHPQVYLIVSPDGRTNVPEPKVKAKSARGAMETILDLAIGRFALRDGMFELETHGRRPFSIAGRNLQTKFLYDAAGRRYRGDLAVSPIDLRYANLAPMLIDVNLSLALEKDRIQLTAGSIRTGATEVQATGALDSLANLHGTFHYEVRASLADLQRVLKSPAHLAGTVLITGKAIYESGPKLTATGSLHAYGVEYRDRVAHIHHAQADGTVDTTLDYVRVNGMRITAVYSDHTATIPGSVQIQSVTLRGSDLEARGVAAAGLGGTFRGNAELRDFDRFRAAGSLAGFDIRRIVAIYSKDPLPWDGLISGSASIASNIKGRTETAAEGRLDITPAATRDPVRGEVKFAYDTRRDLLDLGHSYLTLPHSRLDASGSIGRQLRVRLESRDLADILPAVGAASVPVKIESGVAVFSGTVSGKPSDPRIEGHVSAGCFSYDGTSLDSLAAGIALSSTGLAVNQLQLARGQLRIEGQGALALTEWKAVEKSALSGSLAVRHGSVAGLLDVAGQKGIAASGTLAATAQIGGTFGDPRVAAGLTVLQGTLEDEPFDSFTANLSYGNRQLDVTGAQFKAGSRQIDLAGAYRPAATARENGHLRFSAKSSVMGLHEFRTLEKARPGIKGTLVFTASGALDLLPPQPGGDRVRLVDLQADIRGRGMALPGHPLGDAWLTCASQGGVLRTHLASDYANSRIRGDGQWQLSGDYPGSATISFTRLDFQELSAWIAPKSALRVAGSAEGDLRIDGPARKPELLKATLRIPKLEVSPAPGTAPARNGGVLTLRNQGTIVTTLANQVITVENARFVGHSTDLTLAGKVMLQQRNPLDLRVNGHVDLGILQELDHTVFSSGTVKTDATIRGAFDAPQVNGRLELKDAAVSIADVPNGISHANGTVLFTGDRASIQNLSGETGGGKIRLTGFAGYGGGNLVFRIHARADEIRVRYPEGVSTVGNANLTLTGTSERSMLSGTVTVMRTGFNLQADASSILAKSAEPVRTPAAATGVLAGLNFDVAIATSPDITFQSSLAEGLHLEANLRLRGTASNPALLGRINITQGQVIFFGTKYNINQGSVAFYNAVKVDPVLNVDLETKARGVDVTLTVSGPLNKLTLTPRSDPPLQFSEIVALLATGRTPTSDPSLIQTQANTPQNWQQMGASALLGQAIANPVAGRLQRFFGVSRLKIDPTLTGIESNPLARLTLEQQISQNITFTYITNVTSSNPQVVRVEWAFNRNWSAVAVREENGLFGLDFFYKKRFK